MRVAAIQTTAGPDRDANLEVATALVEEAATAGCELAVLPEYFSVAGAPEQLRRSAEPIEGPTLRWASGLARRTGMTLVAGSFPERTGSGDRISNTSCLVGPDGALLATYRKVHLFDVALREVTMCESATIAPGDELCTARIPRRDGAPGREIGLSICYDLRFPELYRILALRGAELVVVPSAFTAVTGPAHWELLLRARAVENEVFVVAAGQVGELPPGMPACHGHSMVVDPWGTVLAERSAPSPGVVVADLDFERLARIRAELPVLANRRPGAYRWPDTGWSGREG